MIQAQILISILTLLFLFCPIDSMASLSKQNCYDIFNFESKIKPQMQIEPANPSEPNEKPNFVALSIYYSPNELLQDGNYRRLAHLALMEWSLLGYPHPYERRLMPSEDPLTLMPQPLFWKTHKIGIQAVYETYRGMLTPKLMESVEEVELQLSRDRQMVIIISDQNPLSFLSPSDNIKGFFRVFDGSYYRGMDSSSKTHLELLLTENGKSTSIIQSERQKDNQVFELGKFFIDSTMESKDRIKVRTAIRFWLLKILNEFTEEELEKSRFFAHVVTKAHQRIYERDYGMLLVDRNRSQGLDPNENILMVDGFKLKKILQELMK